MADLLLPSRRVVQPPDGVGVDWSNPLTKDLGGLFDTRAGVELVYNNRASNYTALKAASRAGVAADFSSTANQQYAHRPGYATTGAMTIFALMEVRTLSNFGAVIAKQQTTTVNVPFEFRIGSNVATNAVFNFVRASASSGANTKTTTGNRLSAAPGVPRAIAITVSDGLLATIPNAYVDKVKTPFNANSTAGSCTDSEQAVWIGRRYDGETQLDGRIYFVGLWNRELSEAEIGTLTANPWQLFRPIQRRIWVPVAGGDGAVTHTGTGALTGAGSALAGTASSATTRTASGALIGAGAVLAGSASRTAGGTTHDATGVLSGAGSTVTGAASRTRVFSSAGVLQGAGALLSGSADRTGAPTVHDASGALLAAGSALSGAAQHKALHTGSGVLAGGGSALAGSASRVGAAVTHTASGVLAGSGSLLDGTGQVGEIVVANGFVFTDTPSALWWKRKPKALSHEVAEQKIKRVVRVIKEIAGKQQPEQTKKQAQREVAQAVAPMLADMPGFDWTPLYRNIVADFERQREEAARIEAVAQIARIRAIEQDDEDVLILLMI